MNMRNKILGSLLALVLVACGSDDAFVGGSGPGPNPGGGNGGGAIRIGNGTFSGFVPNVVGIAPANISAGGSTSLSVSFVRPDGSLYGSPVEVSFNSPCVAAQTAEFRVGDEVRSTVTTSTGQVNLVYVAKGCVGTDVISAAASVDGQVLEATGTVTVAPASVGTIAFVSATPENIALKNTGEASRPETSAVVFKVTDQIGGPVPGQLVNFTLSTDVGGITLSTPSAETDSAGNVQVVVSSGTVATTVRVVASVASNPAIATQSSALTVSTGIPTAQRFSLSVDRYNIDAMNVDGVETHITARLGDRFGNPVPDGTPVSFQAETGGSIDPQCLTGPTYGFDVGTCTVTFRSHGQRPVDGRVSILATVIGEESFIDTNGDGTFSENDIHVGDLDEPWLDLDEDGNFNQGLEPYYDFFVGDGYTTKDGQFNGVLCSYNCAPSRTIGLGQQTVLVLSAGGAPVVNLESGPIQIPVGEAQQVVFWVYDVNGNPLPATTRVSIGVESSTSTLELRVLGGAERTVASTNIKASEKVPGETLFSYNVMGTGTPGTGVLTVTISVPNRSDVSWTFPITVN